LLLVQVLLICAAVTGLTISQKKNKNFKADADSG
jgi:hypothetical protein